MMKKGKTILTAAVLGALIYVASMTLGSKHPEPAPSLTAAPAETLRPPRSSITPIPARRMTARKAVRSRQATAEVRAEPTIAKRAAEVPLPNGWNGHFVRQDLRAQTNDCDIDRPCSPRGRDGVLLVGVAFALNGLAPEMPQILSVGSYERRTPLLVYK